MRWRRGLTRQERHAQYWHGGRVRASRFVQGAMGQTGLVAGRPLECAQIADAPRGTVRLGRVYERKNRNCQYISKILGFQLENYEKKVLS